VNTLGLERRWQRTSKLGDRVGLRVPLLALAACVVFGASFAISRVTSPTTAARGEAPPSISTTLVSAAVPASLGSVQPIESVLEAPPPPPRPTAKATPAPAPSAPAPAPAPVHEAPAPVHEAPAPVHEAPAPAPEAPAPVPEAPAPTHSSSGGGGGHSSSGGGTFESSG
jgi:hypothetical protein